MDVAYSGDPIEILQTGEIFLLKGSQEECHKACLAHPDCQFYAWYDSFSENNKERCFLRKNKKIPVTEEFVHYGSKTCKMSANNTLDYFFEKFGNGANNGGRDHFPIEYVEALTTAIVAEDLFYAGLYQEANNAVKNLWTKYPIGSSVWRDDTLTRPTIQGFYYTRPYALLRMVEDMSSFRLTGTIPPSGPKNEMVITVALAKMSVIVPTSWDDFFLQNGTMKPNVGVPKTIPFDEKMLADDYKIIQENLRTWIAYIENVVVQGHIDFQVKVIESDEPLQCRIG